VPVPALALFEAALAHGLFMALSLVQFTDIPLPLLGGIATAAGLVAVPQSAAAGRSVDRLGPAPVVAGRAGGTGGGVRAFVVARQPVSANLAPAVHMR
jgi:hypothetical protein